MTTPSSIVTKESAQTTANWIPAEVLATHPRLAQWAEGQSPHRIREVIDGISKKLYDQRYDNLSRQPNPKIARGKVWDMIENLLDHQHDPQVYALGSAVQTVHDRVKTFASMHSLPDPHLHMTQATRTDFAHVLNNRRNSLNHGSIFGFESGMSAHADDSGKSR